MIDSIFPTCPEKMYMYKLQRENSRNSAVFPLKFIHVHLNKLGRGPLGNARISTFPQVVEALYLTIRSNFDL